MIARFDVPRLPEAPLAASSRFHAQVLPQVMARLAEVDALVLVFAPADHGHAEWRGAAVAGLARECTPRRVNGVASDNPAAVAAALAWLEGAPGVTGQYWALDATGAAGA